MLRWIEMTIWYDFYKVIEKFLKIVLSIYFYIYLYQLKSIHMSWIQSFVLTKILLSFYFCFSNTIFMLPCLPCRWLCRWQMFDLYSSQALRCQCIYMFSSILRALWQSVSCGMFTPLCLWASQLPLYHILMYVLQWVGHSTPSNAIQIQVRIYVNIFVLSVRFCYKNLLVYFCYVHILRVRQLH